ncbi:hypothetical protein RZS08_45295, partial [Arthrospira platensis SPKY1]|nr:hypothetical protein [Arthrospira platensis SPKY1]
MANHARVPEKRTFAGLFHILSVGRLHPRKGQLVSALALAELPQPLKARVRWRIAGPTVDATYEREVLAVANQAGIQVERLKDV